MFNVKKTVVDIIEATRTQFCTLPRALFIDFTSSKSHAKFRVRDTLRQPRKMQNSLFKQIMQANQLL